MKPILEIRNISKQYIIGGRRKRYLSLRESFLEGIKNLFSKVKTEQFWALSNINFDVFPGDTIGIIGKNGAGKSTLLKIISRITPPTKGIIKARGRIASLLEVGTGFHPELTGRENIFLNGSILGLKRTEIQTKFDQIVDFSGVEPFLETPLKHFSSGMQLRLAFSVAAYLESEILVVDEVLAVGDAEFQKKCLGKMEEVTKNEGRTVLFVSHNLGAIEQLCNRALLIENGVGKYFSHTKDALSQYTNTNQLTEKVYDKNSIIKKVSISFLSNIEIKAHYQLKSPPYIPHFGFVVSNQKGEAIFASNPTLENIRPQKKFNKEGKVIISISSPTLINGIYNLSIWMGDGITDMFNDINCLTFEISSGDSRSKPLGFIKPTCNYTFL